jgi:hypothetical protein
VPQRRFSRCYTQRFGELSERFGELSERLGELSKRFGEFSERSSLARVFTPDVRTFSSSRFLIAVILTQRAQRISFAPFELK